MKRILFTFLTTVAAVTLLFGYRTSTSSQMPTETATAAGAGTVGPAPAASAPTPRTAAPGTTAAPRAGSSTANGTVTGPVADTRWGPVQVQITVANGRVTAATVVQQPDGNRRDRQINAGALPVLIEETISAQSARIDMVSGATVTSDGYVESLQGALDQAGIG